MEPPLWGCSRASTHLSLALLINCIHFNQQSIASRSQHIPHKGAACKRACTSSYSWVRNGLNFILFILIMNQENEDIISFPNLEQHTACYRGGNYVLSTKKKYYTRRKITSEEETYPHPHTESLPQYTQSRTHATLDLLAGQSNAVSLVIFN